MDNALSKVDSALSKIDSALNITIELKEDFTIARYLN